MLVLDKVSTNRVNITAIFIINSKKQLSIFDEKNRSSISILMDAVFAQFGSLLTYFATTTIRTGDRMMDTILVSLVSIIISSTLIHVLKRAFTIHNRNLLWQLLHQVNNPLQIETKWFEHEDYKTIVETYYNMSIAMYSTLYSNHVTPMLVGRNPIYSGNKYTLFTDYSGVMSVDPHCLVPIYVENGNLVYSHPGHSLSIYSAKKETLQRFMGHLLYLDSQVKNKITDQHLLVNSKHAQCGLISAKKTFDTLFFEQKGELCHLLDLFEKGELYPSRLGMNNKLGILLYGPPGTGKTGVISAVANRLKRDVVRIDFSKIQTQKELDTCLDPNRYNKYIFVFEEFDHILGVLETPGSMDMTPFLAMSGDKSSLTDSIKQEIEKQKDRITWDYLLQKMDGLESTDGRLIIATTNHPENIRPELLRPGRFDLKLCLDRCTTQMYVDILTVFFNLNSSDQRQIKDAKLEPKKWTPLEVINTALINRDLHKTLQALE